jgi:signal transduction histidine kinase/DNA-binding response OmpR family regulator
MPEINSESTYQADVISAITAQLDDAEKLKSTDAEQAVSLAIAAALRAESIGYIEGVARSLFIQGIVALNTGNHHLAQTHLCASRQYAEESNAARLTADATRYLARSYFFSGNYAEALPLFQASARHYTALNLDRQVAFVNSDLTVLSKSSGDFNAALDYAQKALDYFERSSDWSAAAKLCGMISAMHLKLSDYPTTLAWIEKSLDHAARAGADAQSYVFYNAGEIYLLSGIYDKAMTFFSESLKLHETTGDAFGIGKPLWGIGQVHFETGNLAEAQRYFEKSVAAYRRVGDLIQAAVVAGNLVDVFIAIGDITAALALSRENLATIDAAHNEQHRPPALIGLSKALLLTGDAAAATQYSEQAVAVARAIHSQEDELAALIQLSHVYRHASTSHPLSESLAPLLAALGVAERIGHRSQLPNIHRALSETYSKHGAFEKALDHYRHFYQHERTLFNEASDKKLKEIQVSHQVERTKRDAEMEKQKLMELDAMKSRFFANVSHEFRTPLTLILGTLDDIETDTQKALKNNSNTHNAKKTNTKKRAASEKKLNRMNKPASDKNQLRPSLERQVRVMRRSSQNLLTLINELLDIAKLEAGAFQLAVQRVNLHTLLHGILASFRALAEQKNITLDVRTLLSDTDGYLDTNALEKILTNLLSNAIKFTARGGTISVDAKRPDSATPLLLLTVSDTGIGISPEALPHIFDRFYQSESGDTRHYAGSGIGLALVRELVLRHHGDIRVSSILQKGTTFTLTLPTSRDAFAEQELKLDAPQSISPIPSSPIPSSPIQTSSAQTSSIQSVSASASVGKAAAVVLVVEDNDDMRYFIVERFARQAETFQVLVATNGKAGLALAVEHVPDLIISDVMMPEMDGIALVQALKLHDATSHVPVLLLSAKSSVESKVDGVEAGADDYLPKPFHSRELLARAKNLIRQRAKLREKFTKALSRLPAARAATPDEAWRATLSADPFMKKAHAFALSHLADEQYGAAEFAFDCCLSLSQLQRKIKALTGQKPTEFLRTIRLCEAASLLRERKGNVSDVAFLTGFGSNVSRFSTLFKAAFKISPSSLLKM